MKLRSLFLRLSRALVFVCLPWVASPAQTKPGPPYAPDGVDVVVQGALDWELQPLLAALEGKEEVQIAAWTFWKGKIGGKRVVVSRTEVGPINAVAATTLAIQVFKPKVVINQGTAGAHDPELKVFDIILGEATVDFGAFRSSHADAGQGTDPARWTPMSHRIRVDGKQRTAYKNFPGDPDLLETAHRTLYKNGRLIKGTIGSAFEYGKEIDRLLWIRKTFGSSSEDMESAFVAGACLGFKTRFLAIRILSNSEFNAPELKEVAGEYCAAFVVEVIRRLKV